MVPHANLRKGWKFDKGPLPQHQAGCLITLNDELGKDKRPNLGSHQNTRVGHKTWNELELGISEGEQTDKWQDMHRLFDLFLRVLLATSVLCSTTTPSLPSWQIWGERGKVDDGEPCYYGPLVTAVVWWIMCMADDWDTFPVSCVFPFNILSTSRDFCGYWIVLSRHGTRTMRMVPSGQTPGETGGMLG